MKSNSFEGLKQEELETPHNYIYGKYKLSNNKSNIHIFDNMHTCLISVFTIQNSIFNVHNGKFNFQHEIAATSDSSESSEVVGSPLNDKIKRMKPSRASLGDSDKVNT